MQCGWGEDAHLVNGDLFDVLPSQSDAAQLLSASATALLPCPFNRAALIAGASAALVFHLVTLGHILVVLARLLHRYHGGIKGDRWWSTFAGRYALLILIMTTSTIAFNALRLVSLTHGIPATGDASPLLTLSFSPRAGGHVGTTVLLFVSAVAFIGAMGFSVRSTVLAAVATSSKGLRADGSRPTLPWFIAHFTVFSLALFVFNAVVWSLLFVLPTAAASAHSDAAQLTIALLLISLGTVSYWCLASSVTMATKRLSESLGINPLPVALFALSSPHGQGGDTERALPPAASAVHGLSEAQVERRQSQSFMFLVSSVVVRLMVLVHVALSVVFFVLCIVLPSYHLQAYWLYFAQCYWALVCLVRIHVLIISQAT